MSRDHHPETAEASFGGIALDALEAARSAQSKADQVERDVANHEKTCAERYTNINEKIGTLFKLMAWGGSAAFTLIMGLLAFLAKAQVDSVNELKSAAAQRQQLSERINTSPPPIIIQSAPGHAPMEATVERQPR